MNTLHSRDAGNENALAESQACNQDFSRIHVPHPLLKNVLASLTGDAGKSVILTGHAGDGKSTLALAAYKQLKHLDPEAPLPGPLKKREDLHLPGGVLLAIVKDLSEWRLTERDELLAEVVAGKLRVLLVSNTGTLLDTVCGYAERNGLGSRAEWEPRVLKAMDAEAENLCLGDARFDCFNLALHDNLPLARDIFERMLASANWEACRGCSCLTQCPVYRNVALFRINSGLAVQRLFLAYRRMYEYGTRLTIRQLTGHLAYLLTAGLEYADIRDLETGPRGPLISNYLFCNRFFGDDGGRADPAAVRMRVIREVLDQGFGSRPCPFTERHLWLLTHGDDFTLGVPDLEAEFERLRACGSRNRGAPDGLLPDQARQQVRRMIYFLHEFPPKDRGETFLRSFLGSLSILDWERWQKPDARLSIDEASRFKQRVFHVLQEQFTGVRLPEVGTDGQDRLYVTLSRRRQEIRQSAQVVLAQIDYANEFKICLLSAGPDRLRRDLVLQGQGRLDGLDLTLTLPFLDYVLARHQGEVGETLKAAYTHRLESLKADLLKRCRSGAGDDLLLVRLRTNHTFVRQLYAVADGRLEVSNA